MNKRIMYLLLATLFVLTSCQKTELSSLETVPSNEANLIDDSNANKKLDLVTLITPFFVSIPYSNLDSNLANGVIDLHYLQNICNPVFNESEVISISWTLTNPITGITSPFPVTGEDFTMSFNYNQDYIVNIDVTLLHATTGLGGTTLYLHHNYVRDFCLRVNTIVDPISGSTSYDLVIDCTQENAEDCYPENGSGGFLAVAP